MSAACRRCRVDRMDAQRVGDALQFLDVNVVHEPQTLFAGVEKEKEKMAVKRGVGGTELLQRCLIGNETADGGVYVD